MTDHKPDFWSQVNEEFQSKLKHNWAQALQAFGGAHANKPIRHLLGFGSDNGSRLRGRPFPCKAFRAARY